MTGKLSIETQQHPHFQKSIALNGGHISRLGNTPAAHCNNNTIQLWYSPVPLSRQCYSQLSHFYREPQQKPNANNSFSHDDNRSVDKTRNTIILTHDLTRDWHLNMRRNSPPSQMMAPTWKNFRNEKGHAESRKKYWMMWNENTNTFFTGWKYLYNVENILIFIKRLQMFPGHILIIKFLSKFQKFHDFAVSVWIVGNVSSESFNKSDDVIYFGIISCTAGSRASAGLAQIFSWLCQHNGNGGERRGRGERSFQRQSPENSAGEGKEGGITGSRGVERQHGQYSHFTIQEGWKLPPRKQKDAGRFRMRAEDRLLNF